MKLAPIVSACFVVVLGTGTTATVARTHPRSLQDFSECQDEADAANACLVDALTQGTLANATIQECLGCQNDLADMTGTLTCDQFETSACNVVNNCGCGPCADEIQALQQCQVDVIFGELDASCELDCSSSAFSKRRVVVPLAAVVTTIGALAVTL